MDLILYIGACTVIPDVLLHFSIIITSANYGTGIKLTYFFYFQKCYSMVEVVSWSLRKNLTTNHN